MGVQVPPFALRHAPPGAGSIPQRADTSENESAVPAKGTALFRFWILVGPRPTSTSRGQRKGETPRRRARKRYALRPTYRSECRRGGDLMAGLKAVRVTS